MGGGGINYLLCEFSRRIGSEKSADSTRETSPVQQKLLLLNSNPGLSGFWSNRVAKLRRHG